MVDVKKRDESMDFPVQLVDKIEKELSTLKEEMREKERERERERFKK